MTSLTTASYHYLPLQLADAIELMLLSVLSPALKCQWNLSSSEEASITSVREIALAILVIFFYRNCFITLQKSVREGTCIVISCIRLFA